MTLCEEAQARLQKARLDRGWSESELAWRLGINTAWYYDVELCEDALFAELNLSMFFQLCRILDMSPVELATGNKDFVHGAQRLAVQVRAILANGVNSALQEKLEYTACEDIVGDHYLTASDMRGYIEVGEVLSIDWPSSLMADYEYWQQIQPQDRCQWPSYWDYPLWPYLE